MSADLSREKRERLVGLAFTTAAFLFWGLYPPYWKLLGAVPQFQVFAHRVVWACAFTAGIITVQRRWDEVKKALGSRKTIKKGWDGYCDLPIRYYTVSGDHFSIFRKPYVEGLAREFQEALEKAREKRKLFISGSTG